MNIRSSTPPVAPTRCAFVRPGTVDRGSFFLNLHLRIFLSVEPLPPLIIWCAVRMNGLLTLLAQPLQSPDVSSSWTGWPSRFVFLFMVCNSLVEPADSMKESNLLFSFSFFTCCSLEFSSCVQPPPLTSPLSQSFLSATWVENSSRMFTFVFLWADGWTRQFVSFLSPEFYPVLRFSLFIPRPLRGAWTKWSYIYSYSEYQEFPPERDFLTFFQLQNPSKENAPDD